MTTMGRPRTRTYGNCPQCTRDVPLTVKGLVNGHAPLRVGKYGQWIDESSRCPGAGEPAEQADAAAGVALLGVVPRRAEAELLASMARRNVYRNQRDYPVVLRRKTAHKASLVAIAGVCENGWAVLRPDKYYELTSAGHLALEAWRVQERAVYAQRVSEQQAAADSKLLSELNTERHGDVSAS